MFCKRQFGVLDSLQSELDTTATVRPIQILGVNVMTQASLNPGICTAPCDGDMPRCGPRRLPWLQDTRAANVWGSWGVNADDIVVLDAQNRPIRVYTLKGHSLELPANYAELKSILISAAAAPTP